MTTKIPKNETSWLIDDRVRYRKVLDEAVVIHQNRAEALVVTASAHAFLECCERQLNFGQIVSEMMSQYEVTQEQLVSDLLSCIHDMESREIIHRVA
jgi:predicted site-specific integrase-resolvase